MPRPPAIRFEGPFFKGDPARTFRQNVRLMMDRIAEEGESAVLDNMGGGPEALAVRPYVRGRTSSLSGRRWAVSGTVSVETSGLAAKQAVRIMAIAAGRHKPVTSTGRHIGTTLGVEGRTRVFRRVSTAMRRSRKANMDELLRGLT